MTSADDGRRYRELVDGISTVMLTTADLSARPLTVQRNDDDGVTWFLVSDQAAWLDEATSGSGSSVGIAFQSSDTWVSAVGRATVVRDPALVEELGDPVSGAFFDEGETPVALRVDVERAETWSSAGKLSALLEIGKGLITGEKAEPGERESLRP